MSENHTKAADWIDPRSGYERTVADMQQAGDGERAAAAEFLDELANNPPARKFDEEQVSQLVSAAALLRAPAVTVQWHPMSEVPVMPDGYVRPFALAYRNKANGEVHVEPSCYLNGYPLSDDGDEEADPKPTTGWYDRFGPEDDEFYFRVKMNTKYTEVIGWAEMPKYQTGAIEAALKGGA